MSRQIVFIVLSAILFGRLASGCTCFPTQLNTTYFNPYYTRVVSATVLKSWKQGSFITYTLKTNKVYKGCALKSFKARTPDSSAACGITLLEGTNYLIPLANQSGHFSISLCDVRLKSILKASLLQPNIMYSSIKK